MTTATTTSDRLDAELVQQAIAACAAGSRPQWLAERLGASEQALLPRFGAHFRLRALDMAALRQLRPDFDLVAFADCQRRGCVVGRFANDDLVVVVADPTDARLHQWFEARTALRAAHLAIAAAARKARRSTPPRARWSASSTPRCTTRCAPARATSTSRPSRAA